MQLELPKSVEEPGDVVNAFIFGRFRLDLGKQALFRGDHQLTLRPKSFDVLRYLVENAGRVVSRDELFDHIWPGVVVSDDSLTQCLIEIRRTLEDEDKSLVKTILRRGYLFDGEVTAVLSASQQPLPPEAFDHDLRRMPARWTLAALLILSVAIVITWWRIETREQGSTETVTPWQPLPASIAVLPFADMSEARDQQYLAEGIAEEILNLLALSPGLIVIARTSSFSFKGTNTDITTIARSLNVAHVLEGSVRLDGDQVRITAQLVEGSAGVHVWSQTFNDRLEDVFALQDRVARAVSEVLKVELTRSLPAGDGSTIRTPDPIAWGIYLRGRLYYSRRGDGDIMRAQRSFEEALAIDPLFADAWVSLSATYRLRRSSESVPDHERLSREDANPRILDALERALEINPNHPEALWRFAGLIWRTDPDRVIELIGRAAERGHNDAMVQGMMGGYLVERGHPDLALPFLRRAVTLDPLSATHQTTLGHTLYRIGQVHEAKQVLMRALELNPGGTQEQNMLLAWINISQDDLATAASFAEALEAGPDRDLTLAILNVLEDPNDFANEAMTRLLALPADESAPSLAQVYAMMGNTDEAFRWLELATSAKQRSPPGNSARQEVTALQYSPFLVSLHDDERWLAWWSVAETMLLNETDQKVIGFLKAHEERHTELYDPISAMPDQD